MSEWHKYLRASLGSNLRTASLLGPVFQDQEIQGNLGFEIAALRGLYNMNGELGLGDNETLCVPIRPVPYLQVII